MADTVNYTRLIRMAFGSVLVFACVGMVDGLSGRDAMFSNQPAQLSMPLSISLFFALLGCGGLLGTLPNKRLAFGGYATLLAVLLCNLWQLPQFVNSGQPDNMMASGHATGQSTAIFSTLCFIACSLALLLGRLQKKGLITLSQFLLHGVTLLSFVNLLSYLFSSTAQHHHSTSSLFSFPVSSLLLLFSSGAALLHPTIGITAFFTGQTIGSLVARKLFIQLGLLTLCMAYTRLLLYRFYDIDPGLGVSVSSFTFILLTLFILWRISGRVNELSHLEAKEEVRQFAAIVNASADAIISKSSEGIVQTWNNAAEKILGYKASEIIGKPILVLFPPDCLEEENMIMDKMNSGEPIMQYETKRIRKDGKSIDVSITLSPITDRDGKMTGVTKVLRDITETKLAQARLAEVTNRLKLATFRSNIGIWEYDPVKKLLIWDDIMFMLYGKKRSYHTTEYETWIKAIHPDDVERTEHEIQQAVEGLRGFDTDYRVIWPDGTVHYLKARAIVIDSEPGTPQKLLGTNWDVTEEKLTAERLRNYLRLEAKSREMEQFAYVASHDLREPLLTIRNFIGLMKEDYGQKLDGDAGIYMEAISGSADRMETLIKGLLDYSRLSSIKQLQETSIETVIEEVKADLNLQIASSEATLTTGPMPVLKTYPLEIKLLFQNLVANAIKFRRKGCPPVIGIQANKISGGWQFEVTDNGIGISEKDLERIFVIFHRLHSATEYEGTGIGLALCKKITELHHGEIWVKSQPGSYSTFCFTILTDGL